MKRRWGSQVPTREFLSTDPGAPVLAGQPGSFIALLKKVLVGETGGIAYGAGSSARIAAGWTLQYEDIAAKTAVFRNSHLTGTGCYLWVNDAHATNTFFRMYRSMADASDIGTGVDPVPPTSLASAAPGCWAIKNSGGGATPWWGIAADARTFYINVYVDGYTADTVAWFGDFDSDYPADVFSFGCAARGFATSPTDRNNSASGLLIQGKNGFVADGALHADGFGCGLWLARRPSATPGAVRAAPLRIQPISSSGEQALGGVGYPINPTTSEVEYWAPYLIAHEGAVRGRLRGAYIPMHNLTGVARGTKRTNAAGAPLGSSIMVMRGHAVSSISAPVLGGIGIESSLDWG